MFQSIFASSVFYVYVKFQLIHEYDHEFIQKTHWKRHFQFFPEFFNILNNFYNFSFSKNNLIWTNTNIKKKKWTQWLNLFSNYVITNEQNFVHVYKAYKIYRDRRCRKIYLRGSISKKIRRFLFQIYLENPHDFSLKNVII